MDHDFLHVAFEEIAEQCPAAIAVEAAGKRLSYRDLNRNANWMAHLFAELGAQKGEVISVILPAGKGLVTSLLACFKSGTVYLPIDILGFARKRLNQIFTQNRINIVVTSQAWLPLVQQVWAELGITVKNTVVLNEKDELTQLIQSQHTIDLLEEQLLDSNPNRSLSPEDGNYIFYTSGSTGEGKGFLGCHKGLSHFIRWERKEFAIDASVRVSQLSQVTFDASLRDIFLPLTVGGTLCVPDAETKNNTLKLIEWIEEAQITLIHCVPAIFRLITKELTQGGQSGKQFEKLRYVLMAGEALYAKDITNWRQAVGEHVELVNLYGTSETTLAKTFYRIGAISEDPSQLIPAGKPVDDTLVAIINDGVPCLIGEIGEIYIKTPYWTKGYLHDDLNKEVFVQNPLVKEGINLVYKTGDLGKYLKDRSIVVLGRTDNQVKVNGVRIELDEIKRAVLGMPAIENTEVLAIKNHDQGHELICYYVGPEVGEEALKAYLRTELNANLLPAFFVQMPELPLTINGKVDKKALPKPEQLLIREADYEQPEGDLEWQLEAIWKEILDLKRIGTKVSFFTIGGTSLKAVQLISRMYREYDALVKLSDVFTNPTIKQLARVVEKATKEAYQQIAPVPTQAHYDLSHAQQRLWLAAQREENQSLYNMCFAYTFSGVLDRTALGTAMNTVIGRHESLRTTFVVVEGKPRQKINDAEATGFRLRFADLRQLADGEVQAQAIADAEGGLPFDLAEGPLLRATLLQLTDDQHLFLFTTHHIISDGWSMQVLHEEVLSAYNALLAGQTPDQTPLRIQYKDFAHWQNTLLSGARPQSLENYWVNQLGGELQPLDFPADFPRSRTKTFNGTVAGFQLDLAQSAALNAFNKDHKTTLFMTAMALVGVLLYRYTGKKDLIVGTPIAGREHPELENQIGMYVNVLPLRTQLSTEAPFVCFLQKVKATSLAAYEHQQYPYDLLIDRLGLKTTGGGLPFIDVLVQSQDMPGGMGPEATGMEIGHFQARHHSSKVDLTFNFFETEGQVLGSVEYNTDLFRPETIDHLIRNWMHLLSTVLQQPDLVLSDLKLLLSAEEETEFEDFRNLMFKV